ncbi:unnamed protein product [Schistocephalus solidus]|uniref:C2H2-type domain-containing protein n=1 Tax=Schistocephalus solidus TaxID=70667 RepID=A0A183T402_SCHSO|nr:unnamed protein product [Schistocephalus solidus]
MMARVTDNGTVSEAFAVTNGMKQGWVLAPTLFSLMFSAMLMDAYRDESPGFRITYRTDGHLLNSRRMQAPTQVSTNTVHDLLFADDCALNTVTEDDMQRSMDIFANSLLNGPHCGRTFNSHIGLVGRLRIHRTETDEQVPGAPKHRRDHRLHFPHCPRAFTHHLGIFGHLRIHDSGIHCNADNTDTPCTPFAAEILTAIATPTTMNGIPPASSDFSCPHCAHNFNSRMGLVGDLRIHRTEAGKQVPGAPTYSRRVRLHCSRTFTHRMGLLGHERLYDNLR